MSRRARARAPLLAPTVLATLALATAVGAQNVPTRVPPRPELRVDYLGPRPHALQAGLGVNLPVGTYVRLGLIGAGGASWREDRAAGSARADVIARFAFDPFRERRWGLSAGGGLSVRYDGDAFVGRKRWRTLIALLIDLEGPRTGGVTPAFALGLGGGLRAGVILRGGGANRR